MHMPNLGFRSRVFVIRVQGSRSRPYQCSTLTMNISPSGAPTASSAASRSPPRVLSKDCVVSEILLTLRTRIGLRRQCHCSKNLAQATSRLRIQLPEPKPLLLGRAA